jgi:hypothetical protein
LHVSHREDRQARRKGANSEGSIKLHAAGIKRRDIPAC